MSFCCCQMQLHTCAHVRHLFKSCTPKWPMWYALCIAHLLHNCAVIFMSTIWFRVMKAATVKNKTRHARHWSLWLPTEKLNWLDSTAYYAENLDKISEIYSFESDGILVKPAKATINSKYIVTAQTFQKWLKKQKQKNTP